MNVLLVGILMGVAGTVAMDIWAVFAQVGRGKVFHADIGASEPVSGELRLGGIFHYAVGIAYGVIFALLAGADWIAAPTFLPVWIFSLVTILAGWCLLHPGMGLGWFASKTPSPWKTRALGLVAHTVFGLGMWWGALAV